MSYMQLKKMPGLPQIIQLILSIENHCGLSQQRQMAMAFRDTFGADLLIEPINKESNVLPSPEQLKRRVILKHKKLPREGGQEVESRYTTVLDDMGVDADFSANAVKTGRLYLEDKFAENEWHPHFFVLSPTKLCYTKETDTPEQDDERDEDSQSTMEERPQDELHFSEQWFHGKLEGGRKKGEEILQQNSALGDGAFLVRESDTFVGDFSLSFWWRGTCQHCRIKSKQERGQQKYYLIENMLFDSLYSLITYYRQNPLRSQDFTMKLTVPVPQIESHIDKDWYHDNLERSAAEDMLRRIPNDDAFLIRKSNKDNNTFVVSFKADGKVKHCKIQQEGRLYMLGTTEFESLEDLVQYYEKMPLYNNARLRYPVTRELVAVRGIEPVGDDDIYGEDIYHSPNDLVSKIKVKALYDYTASRQDELSFTKGAIITNVNKTDNGWWRGDYNGKEQYWFPDYMVEEIAPQEESAEQAPLGALQKGSIEIKQCKLEDTSGRNDRPYTFKIYSRTSAEPLEMACETETEMKEWLDALELCINNLAGYKTKDRQLERKKCLARQLSDLIVYCIAVPFDLERALLNPNCCEMSSFPETKIERYCMKDKANDIIRYTKNQLSRIFPRGTRLDSSNYDPVMMWNLGSQLVALNYQTPDRSMQLNQAKFLQNGGCGYVLKPEFMMNNDFNPYDKHTLRGVDPVTLTIMIIGARHLVKPGRGIAAPSIEIEICGLGFDNNKYKTPTINDNGLNPIWEDCTAVFDITCPDLALIRFVVQDQDTFEQKSFLGQSSYPVSCLKTGYRSVQLKNAFGEELEMASLLVHVDMRNPKESDDSDVYSCIQDLLEKKEELVEEMERLERSGDRDFVKIQEELREVEENLLAKNEERRQRKFDGRNSYFGPPDREK
ncbi:hypothetical protein KUTeg_020013 [Tegillarca granosa]|uniref:Phosphoinositide phospholipase C n=1 Tax=Tegillarca granosa TaxID=220873 RepID=A0ABQ9EI59_TEGGR|nr:hypothetical protein KUTeg_020013 [Tegillarca granosa]